MKSYSLQIFHVNRETDEDVEPTPLGKPVQLSAKDPDHAMALARARATAKGHRVCSINHRADGGIVAYVTDAESVRRSAIVENTTPVWKRPPGPRR